MTTLQAWGLYCNADGLKSHSYQYRSFSQQFVKRVIAIFDLALTGALNYYIKKNLVLVFKLEAL